LRDYQALGQNRRRSEQRQQEVLTSALASPGPHRTGIRRPLERRREGGRRPQSSATNFTQTGEGTSGTLPFGVKRPVLASIRKTTRLSESWLATTIYEPVGSIAKFRGVFPCVETSSTGVSVPFPASIANTAMLSCPRFEP